MAGATGVKRVKSGCVTCRIRRVKCDETKPACQRCLFTGRKCDGYSTIPFSRRDLQAASQSCQLGQSQGSSTSDRQQGLLPRLITDPAFSDVLHKRYFQYFRQRTVASTNSLVDSRFWDRVVLQACHTEPAIKHAVLALSSLHQLSVLQSDSNSARQHRLFAERQHQQALAEARKLIDTSSPQDIDRILIACIVFICFEGARGDFIASSMHMDSGRAIIAQHAHRLRQMSRRKDLLEIENALARMDLSAICCSDRTSPYGKNLQDFHNTNPMIHLDYFVDLYDAQVVLVDLMRWLMLIWVGTNEAVDQRGEFAEFSKYEAEKYKCADIFERWHQAFENAVERSDSSSALTVRHLRMWYASAMILVKTESYGPQTRYDVVNDQFEEIVEHGEKIANGLMENDPSKSFCFDLGYLIPVFLAGTRCRDPILRRRVIRLLRKYPRQEGPWEGAAAAALAERWAAVEEEGLGEIKSSADVPDYRRIRYVDTLLDLDQSTLSVSLTMHPNEEPRQEFVCWRPKQTASEMLNVSAVSEANLCWS